MRSLHQFVVKSFNGSRYNNVKSFGDVDVIVNTSEEDFRFSSREAIVESTPLSYDGEISEGDILLVHHNVFKIYNDMKGKRRSGKSFFRDDVFLIDYDQFFAYKKDGEWKSYDRYCFVEPLEKEDSYVFKPLTYEPLMGRLFIVNDYLKKRGLEVGDIVCYKPNMEYEFNVDGKLLYRIFDHSVTMKIDG